ncbi:sensor histidine kinase [Dendrosporobacter sp. 1207_IL3150]|uniref:sensor histidine kinase n=1 Tax=Dendrosporobacter sp. 1207_IL3150 TaxID=3084054 RepID=UPI002FDB30A5
MTTVSCVRVTEITDDYICNRTSVGVLRLGRDLVIQYANTGFSRMLGLVRSPIECSLFNYVTSETKDNLALPVSKEPVQTVWHFQQQGFIVKTECTIYLDGEYYLVFIDKPLLAGNHIVATMNTLSIQTANTSREVEKRRRELEHANQVLQFEQDKLIDRAERLASLAAFAAGITHEITQPINAIKVAADSMVFLNKNGIQVSHTEIATDMDEISQQADRINKIIKHLKGLANKSDPNFCSCDLNRIILEAIRLISHEAAVAGIQVKTELGSVGCIVGNETALEEMVLNLLTNSIRALHRAAVKDKQIIVRTSTCNSEVSLEVEDNGTGIDPSIENEIFEPFFTTGKEGSGTGLGLAIVSSIAKTHKARIEVINEYKRGVTFKVNFQKAIGC